MRLAKECIPCLIRRVCFEIDQIDPEIKDHVIPRIEKILKTGYRMGLNSAHVATQVHRVAYRALGVDPYAELKKRATDVAWSLLPRAEEYINQSEDKFRVKTLISIIGNAMDFGISGGSPTPEALRKEFDTLLSSEFIDHSKKLYEDSERVGRVLFLADNCGEIILDRFLLEDLAGVAEVTLMVKGHPVLTDATLKDVREAHLDQIVHRVIPSGPFAVGFNPGRLPAEIKRLMKNSVIISKGMANYEVLSDMPPSFRAYLLMRVKCAPVARSLHVKKGINICIRYERK